MKVGQGLVGAAVAEGRPLLVNDVRADPRYVEAVPGANAELVVPLRRKGRVIGALNLLSDTAGQFTETDEMMLRQFGAHVAVGDRERAALRARARIHQHARDAGRDRAASSARSSTSTSCSTRIAEPDPAGDRLPHLRHPAAERGDAGARDEGGGALRRQGLGAAHQASARAGRLCRAAQGGGARPGRLDRIRATSRSSTMRGRSW